jgi:transposase
VEDHQRPPHRHEEAQHPTQVRLVVQPARQGHNRHDEAQVEEELQPGRGSLRNSSITCKYIPGEPYNSALVLRSSKAVYISAWLDRRAGREEIVPKLLHARAPQNIEEERKIRKLAGSRHAPGDWIFRARIISLSWQGLRTAKIAEKLGCHPKTVRKRLHRFNAEGIDGLGDRPGAGRKPRITEDERSRIIALVSKDPPGKLLTEPGGGLQPEDETKAAYWTLDALAEAANEIGIEVGRSQVRRILLAEGVRWRRTRPWAESADPEFVPKDRG